MNQGWPVLWEGGQHRLKICKTCTITLPVYNIGSPFILLMWFVHQLPSLLQVTLLEVIELQADMEWEWSRLAKNEKVRFHSSFSRFCLPMKSLCCGYIPMHASGQQVFWPNLSRNILCLTRSFCYCMPRTVRNMNPECMKTKDLWGKPKQLG